MIGKKILTRLCVMAIVISQLQPLAASAAGTGILNDYSKESTNTDLSKTIEVSPYPLYQSDTNIAVSDGMVSYISDAEPGANFSNNNEIKAGNGYEAI
ncbi:hypothetical protein RCG23_13060 [Neobacillus sp. PS3-34]|uniref:hypothetical protein n=1 Tax=Neobacillus sp. PS3-34 TaxID=3070678 RepID=UPI0027E05F30|nr:hypothetical protein [Neobacillus sp. PS3-34]WML46587.1 hypothetical protein RCG23_13060 [Neobacillus sp. PS3-34]